MSGYANISAVPDNRILYDAASGATLLSNQRNQLLNQETAALMPYKVQEAQQQVGAADMAAVGQASQGLLTNYPDEASRAAAYPGIVADLQRQGFAKNAPSAYPGEVALKQLAGYAIPLAKQYELGIMVPPGLAKALGGDQTPGAASGGTDPVSGMPVDKALPVLEQRESGGRNIPTQIKNPDGTPASTASGYYQMLDSTFQEGMKLAGIPGTWTRAMDAPREVQTAAANAIYQKYGAAPWAASNPNRRAQTAATPAAPGASQTAAATPQVQIGGAPPAPPGAPPGTSAPIGQASVLCSPPVPGRSRLGAPQGSARPTSSSRACSRHRQRQPAGCLQRVATWCRQPRPQLLRHQRNRHGQRRQERALYPTATARRSRRLHRTLWPPAARRGHPHRHSHQPHHRLRRAPQRKYRAPASTRRSISSSRRSSGRSTNSCRMPRCRRPRRRSRSCRDSSRC